MQRRAERGRLDHVDAVDARVREEEGRDVPQPGDTALRLRAGFEAEAALGRRRLPAEEVTDRVGADLLHGVVEADHVARLRELLARLGDHPLVRQRPLVRGASFEHDAHEEHRVVPEAYLLAHLRDPLGREALLPAFGIIEVAQGRERRDTRVEPAVADLRDARCRRAARRAGDLDVVDPRPVQLGQRVDQRRIQRAFAQLGAGTDDRELVAVVAAVEGERESPVALARDAPVAHVVQPVVHATADVWGLPFHRLRGGEHRLAYVVDADEPLVHEPEQHVALAAPAHRHAVRVQLVADDAAGLAQPRGHVGGDHRRVATLEPTEAFDVVTLAVDRREHVESELLAQLEVLGTAAGRDVDDARTFFGLDVLPGDDDVTNGNLRGKVGEEGLELEADELGAVQLATHRAVGHAETAPARRAQHERLALPVDLFVLQLGVHGRRDVRRQRPGRRRPEHEGAVAAVEQVRADVEREVLGLDVGTEHLVLRQARAATRAPGQRHVALVQVLALEALLQEEPDRFDVLVRVREVRVVPIHPLPEARGLLGDDLCVLIHALAARAREVVEPEGLDVGLALEAERPLDLHLDPQTLAVETVLVPAALTLHRVEADDSVLQRATPRVVHAHGIVRGDRAVEEPEFGRVGAELTEAFEGLRLVPTLQDSRLHLERAVVRVDGELLGRNAAAQGYRLGMCGPSPFGCSPGHWRSRRRHAAGTTTTARRPIRARRRWKCSPA